MSAKHRPFGLPLSLALAAALAACTSAPGNEEATTPSTATPTAPGPAPAGVSLEAYHWDLISATDRSGQTIAALQPAAGKPLRLDFVGHSVASAAAAIVSLAAIRTAVTPCTSGRCGRPRWPVRIAG